MGNTKSTPRMQTNVLARQQVLKNTGAKVEQLQVGLIQNAGSLPITMQTKAQFDIMYNASMVAKKQIERGGKTLTKDDLIAILLILHTVETGKNYFPQVEEFAKFSCEDLAVLIRSIVYDPQMVEHVIAQTMKGHSSAQASAPVQAQRKEALYTITNGSQVEDYMRLAVPQNSYKQSSQIVKKK